MGGCRVARQDRFGNNYELAKCRDKKGNGFFKGFVEIKGKLYAIEVQPQTSTDKKYGDEIMWVRVTEKQGAQRRAVYGPQLPHHMRRGL